MIVDIQVTAQNYNYDDWETYGFYVGNGNERLTPITQQKESFMRTVRGFVMPAPSRWRPSARSWLEIQTAKHMAIWKRV